MSKRLKQSALLAATLLLAIQFARPNRANLPVDRASTLQTNLAVPQPVGAILDRACGDCHSNQTRWPWYSQVAPVSWFVAGHVKDGRRRFNMSEWARYDQLKSRALLGDMCRFASQGEMPLPSYRWLHSEARLGPDDVRALCEWTTAIRSTP